MDVDTVSRLVDVAEACPPCATKTRAELVQHVGWYDRPCPPEKRRELMTRCGFVLLDYHAHLETRTEKTMFPLSCWLQKCPADMLDATNNDVRYACDKRQERAFEVTKSRKPFVCRRGQFSAGLANCTCRGPVLVQLDGTKARHCFWAGLLRCAVTKDCGDCWKTRGQSASPGFGSLSWPSHSIRFWQAVS